ncbi:MAG TPA: porphobilinogen synthase [Pirellulales bacterium]
MPLTSRPRRNRLTPVMRGFARETSLTADRFILPLFVHEGREDIPIGSMPGCKRLSWDGTLREVEGALADGVSSVVLFPAVDESLKTPDGREAFNENGLVPRLIRRLKHLWPELCVVTDVALDPYNSDGHDGIVGWNGYVLNDETVEVLCKQALAQAAAGADIVAPSDMMDGRVAALRAALDGEGFTDVAILAYTAKYASAFYGPFRDALDSAPKSGDKKTYQMDPANRREALRELALDESEGADMVMVKPAGAYLDVIREIRDATTLPVAAYQVSGEYAMIKAASERGWLDERRTVLESLLAIRRAGADVILTYFARAAARWLKES